MTEVLGALLAGLVAGVLHVLSGPDHLAAVLPFAVRGRRQALRVGATWGLGHGLGVLLLGAVAVALRSTVHLEAISGAAEVVVGVMLMVLGAWAIRRSRWVEVHEHEHAHELDPAHDVHHVHTGATGHSHDHADSAPLRPAPHGRSRRHAHAGRRAGSRVTPPRRPRRPQRRRPAARRRSWWRWQPRARALARGATPPRPPPGAYTARPRPCPRRRRT